MSDIIIFGTGTPRSGGGLVSNILSVHKDVIMTTDLIHFFRHIFAKYDPISKNSCQYRLVHEMCTRIKFRKRIQFSPEYILSYFKNVKNYNDVILSISNFFLSQTSNKKIIGEYCGYEWRNTENFLNLNNKFKSFQVIRDPRAVLTSWKKVTYSGGYKYLNILFNWVDAINYSEKYLKNFNKERYLRLKFENIHSSPESVTKDICNFIELEFDKKIMQTENWPNLLNNKLNVVNVSSYNNQPAYGFSKERTTTWKKHIEDWELALTQYLLKDYLKKLNYEIIEFDKNLITKGLKIIEKDETLSKNFDQFIKNNEGTDKRLDDPSKPENWSAYDTSKNIKAKFVDTEDYKNYLIEMDKIKKESEKIIN